MAPNSTWSSFGYDNGGGNTNYDGRYWHADPVGGSSIDFWFLFDVGWGHTKGRSVNKSMPASDFNDKFYEFDYSRVYLR